MEFEVFNQRIRRFKAAAVIVAIVVSAGCGSDKVTVSGRATRSDGSPLARARVTYRSNDTGKWASGVTDSDGHYELGTATKGDGILPGEYYVIVVEDRGNFDSPRPRTIAAKYEIPQQSGLSCTIKSGQSTTYDMVLDTK
jgi:hypothetical protein